MTSDWCWKIVATPSCSPHRAKSLPDPPWPIGCLAETVARCSRDRKDSEEDCTGVIAQQISLLWRAQLHLFQCAMSTRAGTECIAHALQALSEMDSRTTILSIDGVSAFDLISRTST